MSGKGANLSDGLKDMSDIMASYLNISRLQCSRQDKRNNHKDFTKQLSAIKTYLTNYSRIGGNISSVPLWIV